MKRWDEFVGGFGGRCREDGEVVVVVVEKRGRRVGNVGDAAFGVVALCVCCRREVTYIFFCLRGGVRARGVVGMQEAGRVGRRRITGRVH